MLTLMYTMQISHGDKVIERKDISGFLEKEHGIYFNWEGSKNFVNWSHIIQYTLVEE